MKYNAHVHRKLDALTRKHGKGRFLRHFFVATVLAIRSLLDWPKMHAHAASQTNLAEMSLHDRAGGRKYLNMSERRRFRRATQQFQSQVRLFCLTLMWSGGRISEVLAVTPSSIDVDSGLVTLVTLKRRRHGVVREVPLPASLLRELDREFHISARQRDPCLASRRLWSWNRATGWRYIKAAMARANLHGPAAMPKGLRHTFGVSAFAVAPPHLVQRWMGHASLRTTAIYGDVSGAEERAFASRIWQRW